MAEIYKIGSDDLIDRVSQFGGRNLFRLTAMNDRSTFVSNSDTNFNKYFRFYNGSAAIHTFEQYSGEVYQDTILLNQAANLGIAFVRLNSEINLDPNSYYTISCWAKSTQTAKGLCIGLSYYNTSNSWVWRGGSNSKTITAANTWQYFIHTFKPDADIQAICYCFTIVGVASGTDTFTIRQCKLEKGGAIAAESKPTDWMPAPEDLVTVDTTNNALVIF